MTDWVDRSTRWNPNCWAAAGYVVVMINPTGSTGYGQDFVDAINQNVSRPSRIRFGRVLMLLLRSDSGVARRSRIL
jgi:hypothetical protein